MSQYYTFDDEILVQKKPKADTVHDKQMAEELLQSEGYRPVTRPRRVNGGKDTAGAKHTDKNKERLNTTLAKAPALSRVNASTTKRRVARRASAIPTEREKAVTPFPAIYIFFIAILTLMFVYVVHLYIEITDFNSTLAEYDATLVELKSVQNDLEYEKNKLYNLDEIARIAKEEYGMVSADQLPKEYITPDSSDHIQILDSGSEESAAGVLMSGFGHAVSNLLSYIN